MSPGDGSAYRDSVAAAVAEGRRFAGLYAGSSGSLVRALFLGDDGALLPETAAVEEGAVPTIVDLVPAAGWDEREAHDLHGIAFTGHEPLRPLVHHDPELARWTTRVEGHDAYQVAVGPIHAGVIESGHFRFHVVGERILHLDARLFYKYRGLERAAEGRTLAEGAAFVGRACGACAVANGIAYAHACEEALGLEPNPETSRARTILLELERTWSHLNDIAAVCAGAGLAAGATCFAALTERSRRLNAELAGHRLLFGSVQLGGSALDVDAAALRDARRALEAIRTEAARGWRELQFNSSFQDRLTGIGVLDSADALALGTVGPAARACGVAYDARVGETRLDYAELEPQLPDTPEGDVQARLEQRARELEQSLELLERLLERPLAPSSASASGTEKAMAGALVESARGATLCVVERSGERIERVHLRTGSYANWPSVAHAAVDNLLPDFPLINKSFELCYACADR
jgi:Ni,Fe-hydrogenase III large subunit